MRIDLAREALDVCEGLGASYADIRIIHARAETITTRNGSVSTLSDELDVGFGIRVLANGAWGFASSSDLTDQAIKKAAQQAIELAKAAATCLEKPVVLAPVDAYQTQWKTPIVQDPFVVPVSEKIDLLLDIDKQLRSVEGIKVANGFMKFTEQEKLFVSTEGSEINQTLITSGVGYSAVAVSDDDVQIRSYPTSFRGQHQSKGYELIWELPLEDNAFRIAEEAVALLGAPQCPSGTRDLVLGSDQLALQVHESCGHPIELDRVFGTEANFAGRSFLTTEKLNNFQYGSEKVHLTADATAAGGLGTFGFDDEGVPAQKWDIVREGQFVGYLTSRETAPLIGLERSQGTMRAMGWNRLPMIRMNNVSLQPAPGGPTLDELIGDTRDGIYMESNRSWSIDQLRYNFQFGTEIGWEIKKGKKTRMVKNPTYMGMTPEFWRSCDAVCGLSDWVIWGTPNCGKGQPGQIMGTGHGASPARFKQVSIGVGYA